MSVLIRRGEDTQGFTQELTEQRPCEDEDTTGMMWPQAQEHTQEPSVAYWKRQEESFPGASGGHTGLLPTP